MSCGVRKPDSVITLAHGAGGRAMNRLIEDVFRKAFDDPSLAEAHDGATLDLAGGKLAFTTDSFVVSPLFFPGGDIGSLSVYGTVNDLAMCGAEPLYLSFAAVLEEGLEIETLVRIVESAAAAARSVGVRIVTGDTKVVERGKGDGIFINTAGVGRPQAAGSVLASRVRPGDAVIVSGDVGAHGAAILSVRENLELETALVSDCAAVWPPVKALLDAAIEIHCLRDLTRGGLATALCEISRDALVGLRVREKDIPVRMEVSAICEVMGLDPLYMACEGRFAVFVPAGDAEKTLEILSQEVPGTVPSLIGEAVKLHPGEVRIESVIGVERVLDMLSGEQLPRIC